MIKKAAVGDGDGRNRRAPQAAALVRYLRPSWPQLVMLAFILLATVTLRLFVPVVMKRFIDGVLLDPHAVGIAAPVALLYLGTVLGIQVLSVTEVVVATTLAWSATNRIRGEVIQHCLNLPPRFFREHPPGTLIERVDGDVAELANVLSRFGPSVLSNLLLLLGLITVSSLLDIRIALVMAGFAFAGVVLHERIQRYGRPHWQAVRDASADCMRFVEEHLLAAEELRICGAVSETVRSTLPLLGRLKDKALRAGLFGSGTAAANALSLTWGQAFAAAAGAYMYYEGRITLGTVYLLFSYMQLFQGAAAGLAGQVQEWHKAGVCLGRVRSLLTIPHAHCITGGQELPQGPLAVTFHSVTFRYQAGEPVLEEASFAIAPGEVVALSGRTGSGKSTIARLLLGFYSPDSGTIRVGDVDVSEAGSDALRRRIAFVPQDVQLFRASLRDNMTLFDPTVPDTSIEEALQDLGLGEWRQSLPLGLDTVVGGEECGVSAGQAQLIALGRALLRNAGLVILDEATSRLDSSSERSLRRAMQHLFQGRTGIIIAHRPVVQQEADRVLHLEGGRITERFPAGRLLAEATGFAPGEGGAR